MVSTRPVVEMLGATNYWLDRKGKAYMVYHSHAEFAEKTTGIKFSAQLNPGSENNRAWRLQGKAYETMYRNGWVRVSIFGPEKRIQIEFRGSISKPAMEWLQDQAFERKGVVVDDSGRIYADFRDDTNESVAIRIVRGLLETDIDPKALAMASPAINYDECYVWLRGPGSVSDHIPMGLIDGDLQFMDAAYGLHRAVDADAYAQILYDLSKAIYQGHTKGEVMGYQWNFYPFKTDAVKRAERGL